MKNTTPNLDGLRRVSAAKFRDKSLGYLAEVARTGNEIVVTSRGEPIAVISPAVRRPGNTFFGSAKSTLTLAAPIDVLNNPAEPFKALPQGAESFTIEEE